MILDNLNKQIVDAMKANDEMRVSTLKLLSSELHNYKIDHPNMTNEEELSVVKKEAKKRRDSIEAYKKANLKDRAEREESELKILQEFLPEEISDEELRKIVDEVIAETKANSVKEMGVVIGKVMQRAKGNADGSKVAVLVKEKLS
jgi:uncharacterized protein YqeY